MFCNQALSESEAEVEFATNLHVVNTIILSCLYSTLASLPGLLARYEIVE